MLNEFQKTKCDNCETVMKDSQNGKKLNACRDTHIRFSKCSLLCVCDGFIKILM